MELPVYLVTGMLDSGKTSFINDVLSDGFADVGNTLILRCEEGEEEYNPDFLKNVTVVTVDEMEDLTPAYLTSLEKQYSPKQIIVEYNGMWGLDYFGNYALPDNWILYQIMTFVEAESFDIYSRNMGQLMMEKIINADLLVFNRCTDELKAELRGRNLRMVNRRASIYLEDYDGNSEDYLTGDETPFDMDQEIIDIPDDDYGVWYVDVMDHPDRYVGKKVHMKMVMYHPEQFPKMCYPGRFAMVCCENDVTFLGVIAKGELLEGFQNHDWLEVTAVMQYERHKAYKGKGPVMYVKEAAPCEKPKDEVVTF